MFIDDDGEEIDENDLGDYLENFNKVYVNVVGEPEGEYKVFDYSFDDGLKISCSLFTGIKTDHLYNSSMSFVIVESVV